MVGNWPLVGRREELELVERTMEFHEFRAVVLAGASGVGKSRLAWEALAAARARGWVTVDAVATRAAATIPFGAVAHLLPPPTGGRPGRLEILRQVRRSLLHQARGRPLALLVDDAHLLDQGSAALVHQLAATETAFVLVSLRSAEAIPDYILALWKDGLARRIEIQPLSDLEVGELVNQVLDGHVDGATLRELARVSNGNVLFLRELVHSGLTAGSLAASEGIWRWRGPMAPSGALLTLIEERFRGLGNAERRLLEAVAMAEPLGSAVLPRLGTPESAEAAEAAGVLAVVEDRRRTYVRLAHPLYTEVLRANGGVLRSREIGRQLAAAIEATGARRKDDLLRVAVWRLDAGERPEAWLLCAAATRAHAVGDYALAERLARAAEGGGFPATFLLAQALMRQERGDEVESLLASAETTTDEEVARLAVVRATNLFWGLGDTEAADEVLRRAAALCGDPHHHGLLAGTRAVELFCLGRPREALSEARTVLSHSGVSSPCVILASFAMAASHAFMGRTSCSLEAVDRGFEAVRGCRESYVPGATQLSSIQWIALWVAGRLDEADKLSHGGYRRCLEARADHARGQWCFQLGHCALIRGRARAAADWLQEAVVLLREHDPTRIFALATSSLAHAAALTGDVARADGALEETVRVLPHERSWVELNRAWVMALRGDVEGGRAGALHAAEMARAQGFASMEAVALHGVARLGDPWAVASLLDALAARGDGVLVPAMAAHAAALVDGEGDALLEATSAFESIGAVLCAAEASEDAARAFQRGGRPARARAARARAQALAERCDGVRTPALARSDVPEVLTSREQEIAQLAAAGFTSREIAAQLSVSVRTVDNHLQKVYAKLEVSNRRELATILQPGRQERR